MYDLNPNFTLIQTIDTRNNPFNFQVPIRCIDYLLPEWIFTIVVNGEICRQSLIQERVLIFKNYLDLILTILTKQLSWDKDAMINKTDVSCIDFFIIYHEKFNADSIIVDSEMG